MPEYKYPFGSVWLSYTALGDLKKCRKLYILRNTRKIGGLKPQVVNPHITLGEVVHETLNVISKLPKEKRFLNALEPRFLELWQKFHGIKGGFDSDEQEEEFKTRGIKMIRTVEKNPGVLKNLAIRITEKDGMPPNFLLSKEECLVLCGNIDWIEVLPDGTLHVIDFKTGKNFEEDTLQFQIYCLLMQNKSKRKISKISYWYLDLSDEPIEVEMPDMTGLQGFLVEKGREMKLLRSQKEVFCIKGGCKHCKEYEAVFDGSAEFVGVDPLMNKACFCFNSKTETADSQMLEQKQDEINSYSKDLPF